MNPNSSRERKEGHQPKQRKQSSKIAENNKEEENKKEQHSNTEEGFNLALGAELTYFIALNVTENMPRNFIPQFKMIIDLFKGKRN